MYVCVCVYIYNII